MRNLYNSTREKEYWVLNSSSKSSMKPDKSWVPWSLWSGMEPNVLQIRDPLVVVGDIHGQYYDLLSILKQKSTEKNKFLFLGDYVDRGLFSIQVIVLILCLKINSPKSIFMLRGNHETRQLTTYFNFRHQCT